MNSPRPPLSSHLSSLALGAAGQVLALGAFLLPAPWPLQAVAYVLTSVGVACLLRL